MCVGSLPIAATPMSVQSRMRLSNSRHPIWWRATLPPLIRVQWFCPFFLQIPLYLRKTAYSKARDRKRALSNRRGFHPLTLLLLMWFACSRVRDNDERVPTMRRLAQMSGLFLQKSPMKIGLFSFFSNRDLAFDGAYEV